MNHNKFSVPAIAYASVTLLLFVLVVFFSHSGIGAIGVFIGNIVENFDLEETSSSILEMDLNNNVELTLFFASMFQTTFISRLVGKLLVNASLGDRILMFVGTSFLACFFNLGYAAYPINFYKSETATIPAVMLCVVLMACVGIKAIHKCVANKHGIMFFLLYICVYTFINPVILGFFAVLLPFLAEMLLYGYLYDNFLFGHPILLVIVVLAVSYPLNTLTGNLTNFVLDLTNGSNIPFTDIIYGGFSFFLIICWFILAFIKTDYTNIVININGNEYTYRPTELLDSGIAGTEVWWDYYEDYTLIINGNHGKMSDFSFTNMPWFDFAEDIQKVVIMDGVTYIGDYAFTDCANLSEVYISKNVNNIGSTIFLGCNSLVRIGVDVDNKTYASEDGVLYSKDMTTLLVCPYGKTEIFLPESVTTIKENFTFCLNLNSINVDENNDYFASEDGVLYSKDQKQLIRCPIGKTGSHIINNHTIGINDEAFQYCRNIEKVILSENVTYLGTRCFESCVSIKTIEIPANVQFIENYAFMNCNNLNKVSFRGNAPLIADEAFLNDMLIIKYPSNDSTWLSKYRKNYGGMLSWIEESF